MSREESAMDGVHDLGGMQGFGRVEREDKEPVFHAPWEAEMRARTEFFAARPDAAATAALSGPLPGRVPFNAGWAQDVVRQTGARPRFAPGDPVITRNIHPRGHTRLPRYARGKRGVIHGLHGVHVFPDSNAHGLGEQPQPLYSVRFEARELWGEAAEPNQRVHLDLWEAYLEPGR